MAADDVDMAAVHATWLRNLGVKLWLRRQAYRQAGEAGGLCIYGLVNRSWRCAWKAGAAAMSWSVVDEAYWVDWDLDSFFGPRLLAVVVAMLCLVLLMGPEYSSDEAGDGPRTRGSSGGLAVSQAAWLSADVSTARYMKPGVRL